MRKINYLCYIIVLLTFISAVTGIFYSSGTSRFTVVNIYGENVELYGDGIYKYDSVLKAGINKGTDVAMLIVSSIFAIVTLLREKAAKYRFLQLGLLLGLFYYSACLVFGVTFNRLFLIYILLFSSALFAMIFLLYELIKENNLSNELTSNNLLGTALFIILCGSSVLMWLKFIIPAIIADRPLENIGIYTTEPTFVLDLAIILPTYLGCAIAIFKKRTIGYKLVPILLTFIIIIGLTVISQTLVQTSMGIIIPIKDMIGLVISFIVLGIIGAILNVKFLKYIK